MTSLAIAAFLAVASLSSSSAHALITITSPKTTNSGNNDVHIGAYGPFFGAYYLAKCEDGSLSILINSSTGNSVNLGSSPNLPDNIDFKIFQNGNDTVRVVPVGGFYCGGAILVPVQPNGHTVQVWLSGGNDNLTDFNMGASMVVYGGAGDDVILTNIVGQSVLFGDGGSDQLSAWGPSSDVLLGGTGNDFLLWGGSGFNYCDGNEQTDQCSNSTCSQKANCETGGF